MSLCSTQLPGISASQSSGSKRWPAPAGFANGLFPGGWPPSSCAATLARSAAWRSLRSTCAGELHGKHDMLNQAPVPYLKIQTLGRRHRRLPGTNVDSDSRKRFHAAPETAGQHLTPYDKDLVLNCGLLKRPSETAFLRAAARPPAAALQRWPALMHGAACGAPVPRGSQYICNISHDWVVSRTLETPARMAAKA